MEPIVLRNEDQLGQTSARLPTALTAAGVDQVGSMRHAIPVVRGLTGLFHKVHSSNQPRGSTYADLIKPILVHRKRPSEFYISYIDDDAEAQAVATGNVTPRAAGCKRYLNARTYQEAVRIAQTCHSFGHSVCIWQRNGIRIVHEQDEHSDWKRWTWRDELLHAENPVREFLPSDRSGMSRA